MKETKIIAIALLAVAAIILAGCTSEKKTIPETLDAKAECISLCQAELQKGTDLSSGPCIGNPLSSFPDWVCDVAHEPREAVDDNPANQCSAFREGKAKHFVEVDESCKVIKEY